MKTILKLAIVLSVVAVIAAALVAAGSPEPEFERSYAGRYVGYSWRGEAGGTAFEDANQYIKTVLELDHDGIITDARIWFFVQRDGFWIPRQSGNAYVAVDFEVDPTPATGRIDNYEDGDSMFTVHTADMMSFYAAAVNSDGTVAAALVCPVTRYMFEMKFSADYDFSREFGELTIGSGEIVPTYLTSGASLVRPQEWNELADKHFLNIHFWSHVVNDVGVLGDITASSSLQGVLEALGVSFSGGEPQPLDPSYGYFGVGGWNGNLNAIAENLIGVDATEKTSLIDWSIARFGDAIDDQNRFGVDVPSGATRTVQDSIDTISGATVRVSREATSYQRALVAAGIIDESEVVIGRF